MSLHSKVLTALGVAAALASGSAHAAGLVSPGNQFLISGSTALDNQIKDALLLPPPSGPCKAGTISIYTDAPAVAGGNLTKAHQTTVVCTLAADIGTGASKVAANTVVAFTKESNGGSNEGTFYEAAQQKLTFFDATQAPTGCTDEGAIAAGHYWTHQQAIADEQDGCTGALIQAIPQIGVADEDPAVFNLGLQAISPALIANLNTTPLFQNQFGIVVSLNLYRKLQTAQGLTQDDTLANMPSLTKQTIAGLLSGVNTDWSAVSGAGVSGQVYVCRRGQNSGTETSADIFFLGNRCISGNASMALDVAGTIPGTTGPCAGLPGGQTPENNGCTWTNGAAPGGNLSDAVFAGTATGDVLSCLDAHSRAGTYAIGFSGTTSKFDDPLGATGAAGEPGTNHWRYIAYDGNKPTVAGMANGTYAYAMDNVENVWTGLTGQPLSVATYLGTVFQDPTALEDILVAQPNAQNAAHTADPNFVTGGLLDALNNAGIPQNTVPVATSTLQGAGGGNPVSGLTRAPLGGVTNCQPAVAVGPSLPKEQF